MGVGFARVFYRHALRSAALALAVFAVVGSTAAGAILEAWPYDPVIAVIGFFAWGMIGAAVILALREPPF